MAAADHRRAVAGRRTGHDPLFIRHAAAPVTTLVVKDRVLHNPVAGLYTAKTYGSLMLDKQRLRDL